MADIIISRNIVQKFNAHNLAARITSSESIVRENENGDLLYEASAANKDYWNLLNQSSQESLFRRFFHEHMDLIKLIEEDMRTK